jgi:hypothetical protein
VWEEHQVGEYSVLLNNIVLHDEVEDKWQWNLHSSKKIIVRIPYHYLMTLEKVIMPESTYIT